MMKAMTPHTSQTSAENIVISIMDMADGAEKRLKRRADENSKVTMDIYAMFGYNSIKELSDDVNSALIPQGVTARKAEICQNEENSHNNNKRP